MKKIKAIIGVIIVLIAILIMISGLYNDKNTPEDQTTTKYVDFKIDDKNTTEYVNEIKNKVYLKITKKKKKTTKKTTTKKVVKTNSNNSNGYRLTHYGYDCCKIGRTATGYDISKTIYYNDATYGKVRIVAMCSKYPLYSIIKIKNYKLGGDTLAIVLDRGVGCGTIDLAVKNEKTASKYGIQNNVKIEVLRNGR